MILGEQQFSGNQIVLLLTLQENVCESREVHATKPKQRIKVIELQFFVLLRKPGQFNI